MLKRTKICRFFAIAIFLTVSSFSVLYADLTLQGPSGFIQVPSHRTINHGQIEWAAHTRMFRTQTTGNIRYLTNLAVGFSPIRDLEIGAEKAIDSRRRFADFDPDPTVNVKVRLPSMGSGEYSETAFGILFDANPNNYHSLYFSVGGFGLAWNFGGNPGSGIAHYGAYDRGRKAPKPLALIIGADLTPGNAGERGYRSHYYLDYNGDVFSLGWRYKSHRGFWADASLQSNSSYTDFYRYRPFIVGLGAIF